MSSLFSLISTRRTASQTTLAAVLIAACTSWAGAAGQNDSHPAATHIVPVPAAAAPANCVDQGDTDGPQRLIGIWTAQFDDGTAPARLELRQHPDWSGSVRGLVYRHHNAEKTLASPNPLAGKELGAGGQHQSADKPVDMTSEAAGDLDDGEFFLEESVDGTSIQSTWIGQFVENSCGKEIRGTWSLTQTPALAHSFVLRKSPSTTTTPAPLPQQPAATSRKRPL